MSAPPNLLLFPTLPIRKKALTKLSTGSYFVAQCMMDLSSGTVSFQYFINSLHTLPYPDTQSYVISHLFICHLRQYVAGWNLLNI